MKEVTIEHIRGVMKIRDVLKKHMSSSSIHTKFFICLYFIDCEELVDVLADFGNEHIPGFSYGYSFTYSLDNLYSAIEYNNRKLSHIKGFLKHYGDV